MIKKIGVKNFRVFKDYTEFEIRPITILTGPNNSGKSSFTKLLLLLKNNVTKLNFEIGEHNLTSYDSVLNWEKSKDEGILHSLEITLSNLIENVEADTKTTLIFDQEGSDIIEFKIEIDNKNIYNFCLEDIGTEEEYNGETRFCVDCNKYEAILDTNQLIDLIKNNTILFNSEPLYNFSAKSLGVKDLSSLTYEKLIFYKKIFTNKNISDDNNDIDSFFNSYKGDLEINLNEYQAVCSNFSMFLSNYPMFLQSNFIPLTLKGLLLYNHFNEVKKVDNIMFELVLDGKNISSKYSDCIKAGSIYDEDQSVVGDFFSFNELGILDDLKDYERNFECSDAVIKEIKKRLEKFLSKKELENLKVTPSKLNKFIFHKTPLLDNKSLWEIMISNFKNINHTFKYIDYVQANRSQQNRVVFFNYKKDAYSSYVVEVEKKFLKEIQSLFELPGEIKTKEFEHSVYALYLDNINLADFGFGFSQLIPIILKVIHSQKNTTLIIEEPEANLHPKLQSKLADFFAISQKYFPTVNFIIETHSEYLIRKLQYLTAKKEIKTEDSIIYYFNDDKYVTAKEPKVKSIEIIEDGGLTDTFGAGFFDETTRLQFELAKLNKSQNK